MFLIENKNIYKNDISLVNGLHNKLKTRNGDKIIAVSFL